MRAKNFALRYTLPRLCHEISNVIDMNVRKEKNGILNDILRIINLHTLKVLQRGTISIRKMLFVF
jgi:hypothetical protein